MKRFATSPCRLPLKMYGSVLRILYVVATRRGRIWRATGVGPKNRASAKQHTAKHMTRRRFSVLSPEKRRRVCALLQVGCSRSSAARYVGVDPGTIRYHAIKSPKFAEALRKAEMFCEVNHLKNINQAAEKSWRASAWYLERRHGDDYCRKDPERPNKVQISKLLKELAGILAAELPNPEDGERIINRLRQFTAAFEDLHDEDFPPGT